MLSSRSFGYQIAAVLAAAATAATVLVGVAAVPAHVHPIGDRTTSPEPYALAVNETTNTLYITSEQFNIVTAVDGATKSIKTIPVGTGPRQLAVNEITNKVYVANYGRFLNKRHRRGHRYHQDGAPAWQTFCRSCQRGNQQGVRLK